MARTVHDYSVTRKGEKSACLVFQCKGQEKTALKLVKEFINTGRINGSVDDYIVIQIR